MIHIKYYNALITVCMVLILIGCTPISKTMPCDEDPRCLLYGITSDILILDPHVSDSPDAGIVFRQIYDTLVYRDPITNEIIPGLAESWDISNDGLLYTFKLRQNVLFHDGTLLTAGAVARNIDRIFDPEINSAKARSLLGSFSRYEIVNEYTIQIYLFEPYVAFLDGLAQPYIAIVSPTSLDSVSNLRYQFHQIGTGPFKLTNYVPGVSIELVRNIEYRWTPSLYQPLVGGEINRIVFKILPDPTTRTDNLLRQTVDVIGDMLPSDANVISNNSSIQLRPVDIPGQSTQFYFNTQRLHTDNEVVRQSLLYATNRVGISDEIYLNFSSAAWAPLSQANPYSHTGYVNVFSYDALVAADLLASAGYRDTDGDGFLDLGGEKLELIMVVPPWGQLPDVANYLRNQWRSLGIDLVIDPVPGLNSLMSRLISGDYHLISFDNFGFDPSLLNATFLSTSPNNISGFTNEELDDLLRSAVQERDNLARRNQYFEIQSIIMENALILPIRDYVNINGLQSYVTNLRYDAYGWYPILYNVRLDV